MCQIASVSLREVDLGDLGAALASQAFLGALVALAVDGVFARFMAASNRPQRK
jgi:hypothetical protein